MQKTARKNIKFSKNHNILKSPKWPPCKGYSLWKVIVLDLKLKMLKACEKQVEVYIEAALCKQWLVKSPNFPKITRF